MAGWLCEESQYLDTHISNSTIYRQLLYVVRQPLSFTPGMWTVLPFHIFASVLVQACTYIVSTLQEWYLLQQDVPFLFRS